jgi:hypothetical protein
MSVQTMPPMGLYCKSLLTEKLSKLAIIKRYRNMYHTVFCSIIVENEQDSKVMIVA